MWVHVLGDGGGAVNAVYAVCFAEFDVRFKNIRNSHN